MEPEKGEALKVISAKQTKNEALLNKDKSLEILAEELSEGEKNSGDGGKVPFESVATKQGKSPIGGGLDTNPPPLQGFPSSATSSLLFAPS